MLLVLFAGTGCCYLLCVILLLFDSSPAYNRGEILSPSRQAEHLDTCLKEEALMLSHKLSARSEMENSISMSVWG